jgi:hypothetical protein
MHHLTIVSVDALGVRTKRTLACTYRTAEQAERVGRDYVEDGRQGFGDVVEFHVD